MVAEFTHLQLLAEIDALVELLGCWADSTPAWPPAETCRALVRRLAGRAESLRVRLEAPLVVATLGGTGTGKSALVNALAGAEVVRAGRQRPTTLRPTLISRSGITPELLGIDPGEIDVVHRDLPSLAQLVLIDCPDPDTTEDAVEEVTQDQGGRSREEGAADAVSSVRCPRPVPCDSTLQRLRRILPHCDVLLVTTTQQKYRSARVDEELAAAASGARLVFVQTHADVDADIRDDWRQTHSSQYATGHIFLVDSPAALADVRQGRQPRGEFAALLDLLSRQFAGAAAVRIRRANFLDLAAETLEDCRRRLDAAMPAVEQLRAAIDGRREQLAGRLSGQIRGELLANRRPWESRLLGQITSRWGLSPFALVLRIYQGLGALASGALLYRARTPAQLALWGTVEGARAWQKHRRKGQAEGRIGRTVTSCWDEAELRSAALVLEGYAAEAGFPRQAAGIETIAAEADRAGLDFAARLSTELDGLIARLAERHTGWFTRWRYELLLLTMLALLLYRLGKNFFYDSWWAANREPAWGLQSYLVAGFWLVLWCLMLLWAFTRRLRRGLRREVDQLAQAWTGAGATSAIFARLEGDCHRAEAFRRDLQRLEQEVRRLRQGVAMGDAEVRLDGR
jgi:hypothetical protein